MQMRKRIIKTCLCATLVAFLIPCAAFAAECNGVETTLIACNNGDAADGVTSIVKTVVGVLLGGVLVVATIGVIVAGVQYMSARDNAGQSAMARRRLVNTIVGLVAFALIFGLFSLVTPGGYDGAIASIEAGSEHRQEVAKQQKQKEEQEKKEKEQKQKEKQEEQKQPEEQEQPKEQEQPEETPVSASSVTISVKDYQPAGYKRPYRITSISAGAIPYVYTPNNGYGLQASAAIDKLKGTQALVVANAGTFNTASGANNKATGTVIVNGAAILSGNSCTTLVFDRNGQRPGWSNSTVDAASLISGHGSYYDIHGNLTSGAIYSAVSCFAPIIVNGKIANGKDSSFNFSAASSHYKKERARQILCVKENASKLGYAFISNKNEEDDGGWTFTEMANVARDYGCTFAYNLDGGGSTATWTRSSTAESFDHYGGSRSVPTYIVFTANNQPL